MGIISICISCETCNEKYRLRYNVGNKYPQSSTFICDECGDELTIGLDESENFIFEGINQIDHDRNIKVLNLHPELPIDMNSRNDPYYFPSMVAMRKQNKNGEDGLIAFKNAQGSCIAYQNFWDGIKKDFRYLKEKRWKFLYSEYGKNHSSIEQEVLLRIFFTADFFLEGIWKEVYLKVDTELNNVMAHPKFEDLKSYLLRFKDDFFFNKMFDVMNKYRVCETILLPTLLDQKCGFKPQGISSKINWQEIKLLYGSFYEIYGDILVVPTMINNLLVRNDPTKFATENFSLENYLDSDKSGRCRNFLSNNNLEPLSKFYDSGIRNGTYHEGSIFDNATQMVLLKTGKGGRRDRLIPLIEYIEHCNEIYARLLIIFRIYFKLIN